jgi:hypothetical protein
MRLLAADILAPRVASLLRRGLSRLLLLHQLIERAPAFRDRRPRALERLTKPIDLTQHIIEPGLEFVAHLAAALGQEQVSGDSAHQRANSDGQGNASAIVHFVLLIPWFLLQEICHGGIHAKTREMRL